ncbi:hypothetical protein MCEMSEM18_01411 [Comamonadaceae bacterium]
MSSKLSTLQNAIDWLNQMDELDRPVASQWLDDLRLVDSQSFNQKLRKFVHERASKVSGGRPIALYVERELAQRKGLSQFAFWQKNTKNPITGKRALRSFGPAVKFKLLASQRTTRPEAGSEAIVANLMTGLQRAHRKEYYLNAGPDEFRRRSIRTVFVVTDFIGTGDRAWKFLNAFWRMPTIKSWRSTGLVQFHILAYSATAEGVAHVRSHPIQPEVHWLAPCPTIRTLYTESDANRIKEVLVKYDPVDKHPIDSLGYRGQGAMLIFSHGCPNNAPRALYKADSDWIPLFVGRSNTLPIFNNQDSLEKRERAFALLHTGRRSMVLSSAAWTGDGHERLLVLAALKSGHRFRERVAEVTGLDLSCVDAAMDSLKALGWVAASGVLTAEGRTNLQYAGPFELRKTGSSDAGSTNRMYYPKSLREPFKC